jgi:Tfp pilus assembly protein PilZ
MASADERRKRIRVPVQSKIRHSQYQVLGTPVFQENSSIDLSSGGISFETAREYQIGNLVLLEVEVNEEPLKLLVCVAWVKPTQDAEIFQVGAELIAVDPVHKRKMQKHLNAMLSTIEKARKAKLPASKKTAKKSSAKKATSSKAARKKVASKKAATKKSASKKTAAKKTAKKKTAKKKK